MTETVTAIMETSGASLVRSGSAGGSGGSATASTGASTRKAPILPADVKPRSCWRGAKPSLLSASSPLPTPSGSRLRTSLKSYAMTTGSGVGVLLPRWRGVSPT